MEYRGFALNQKETFFLFFGLASELKIQLFAQFCQYFLLTGS